MDKREAANFLLNFLFSVVILPMILNAAQVHWPVIVSAATISAGLVYLWGHSPSMGWRKRVVPIALIVVGLCVFAGGAAIFQYQNVTAKKSSTPKVGSKGETIPAPQSMPSPTATAAKELSESEIPKPLQDHFVAVSDVQPLARIRIDKFDFQDAPNGQQFKKVVFTARNKGTESGDQPHSYGANYTASRVLSAEEVDVIWREFWEMSVSEINRQSPKERGQTQIDPNDLFTSGEDNSGRVSVKDFDDMIAGRSIQYIFVVLIYTDRATPPGTVWASEFCAYQQADLTKMSLCPVHNRIRLHTIVNL